MAKRAASLYQPQLATLVKTPPVGERWVHEMKLDGYRIGAVLTGGAITLISRNQNDWTAQFPTIVAGLKKLRLKDAILDGELCAVLPDGKTSFHAMQHFRSGEAQLVYFVFDVLRLAGKSLIELPLLERKAKLAKALGTKSDVVAYVDHVEHPGKTVLREACKLGMEGIVSKLRDAPYAVGKRSDGWLKTKCVRRQELVIGGFVEPTNPARGGIGSLLVGYYDKKKQLVFAGGVGTGWKAQESREIRERLDAIRQEAMPFTVNAPTGAEMRRGRWVKPTLVAEVQFVEWTPDGHVRHPSFQGLRNDKPARRVVRED